MQDMIVLFEYGISLVETVVYSFGVRILVGFLCAMGFLIYKFQRRHSSVYEDIESFLQSDNQLSPIRYSYSQIKKITNGFREKLGEGGFASVYKGKLRSGHYVAVKLLGEKGSVNDQDFINEIRSIGSIHHENIVKLVGYCAERSKRALLLDFMPNGSLNKYISEGERAASLDWGMKFKLALGVARGIEYLHGGCDMKILHFDIKPHNILVDENFVPKISDFGLAKLYPTDKESVTLTTARGTIGFVAPEIIDTSIGRVSHKADVYSFGMLLMEIAGVNKGMTRNTNNSSQYFPYWVYDRLNRGKGIANFKAEINNVDDENEIGKSIQEKMAIVGLWCIRTNPDERPSMRKVLEMLEAQVGDLKIPDPPVPMNVDQSYDENSTASGSLRSTVISIA